MAYRSERSSNFSPALTSDPRGFHLENGPRNCPEEGEESGLSLSGITQCKYCTNKFLPENNGGLERQEDEMRKEEGGRQTKVDAELAHQLVSKRFACT